MNVLETTKETVDPSLCLPEIYDEYIERLKHGELTRDENGESHFCVYFLPYNPVNKTVFIIHHKKSGLWLTTGGHIDKGETPLEALRREMNEELGVSFKVPNDFKPFLLTITPINNPKHPCRKHFDIWYRIETDGSDFNVDPREFLQTKWATLSEARELITDGPNLEALEKVERTIFNKK